MSMYTYEYDRSYHPAAPVVEVVISGPTPGGAGANLLALVDTGADATMLPIDTLTTVGARYIETRRMRGVTGHTLAVDAYLVTVQVGPYVVPGIESIAMSQGTEAILGRDVLNQLIITLNGLAHIVEVAA